MTTTGRPGIKGRGSTGYLPGRFAVTTPETVDDGWHEADTEGDLASPPQTEVTEEVARSVITRRLAASSANLAHFDRMAPQIPVPGSLEQVNKILRSHKLLL